LPVILEGKKLARFEERADKQFYLRLSFCVIYFYLSTKQAFTNEYSLMFD
jgi:hypothetical protein